MTDDDISLADLTSQVKSGDSIISNNYSGTYCDCSWWTWCYCGWT